MLNSTPEYVRAYQQELGDHPPKVAEELKAKYRTERGARWSARFRRVVEALRPTTESTTAEAPRSRPNPAS